MKTLETYLKLHTVIIVTVSCIALSRPMSISAQPPQDRRTIELKQVGALIGCGGVEIAYSGDGKRIITTDGTTAQIWDAATFRSITSPLDHHGTITKVSLSFDGQKALTVGCSVDRTGVYVGSGVKIWDIKSGRRLLSIDSHAGGQVCDAALTPNGEQVATCAVGDRSVHLWNIATGEILRSFKMDHAVAFVIFGPDGTRILTVQGAAVGAQQWNTKTGEPIGNVLRCNGDRSDGVERPACYSRDGKLLALCNSDRFYIYDVKTGDEIANSESHQLPIPGQMFESIDLSDNGKVVATTATQYGSRAWETKTGNPLMKTVEDLAGMRSVISPDGNLLLCGGPASVSGLWKIREGIRVRALGEDRAIRCGCFSPDGRFLATTLSGQGGFSEVWELSRARAHVDY